MKKSSVFMWIMFFVSFCFDVLPLPGGVIWFKPSWTLLVLIYFCLKKESGLNYFHVLILGFIVDLLGGNLLGMHAFVYVCVYYFLDVFKQHVRQLSLGQQLWFISLFVVFEKLTILIIQLFIAHPPGTFLYWLGLITNIILWPWLFLLLNALEQRHVQ